jgi:polyisoprenyl-teichoic acid--peptidoglycan teichoic acid transferase
MKSRRTARHPRQNVRRPKPYEVAAILIFVFLFFLLAFILLSGLLNTDITKLAQAYALETQKAMNTEATPTPFQPVGDPNNPSVIQDSNIDSTLPNSKATTSPTATLKTFQKPEGQVNILLLGSDIRPDDGGFRTDIIVWVSMNPKDGYVSAISFPRDLYVNIPGYGNNRINVAFPYGGFDLLADTFEDNFAIRPDRYAIVDFEGFKAVINNLGGINVQTAQNLTDTCAKWINPSGVCSVGPGLVNMNGELALWYARSRYSTNDIDRSQRAQEVLEAIFNRLMKLDVILKAPDLYNAYTTYVQTNISLGDVVGLLPLASEVYKNNDLRSYVIGYDQAYDWITYSGAQVLLPDYGAIQEVMIEALSLE